MQVILLERIERLGQMGDVVTVKPGYARNFLLPKQKAMRATKQNLAVFENQKAQLEAVNLERRQEAESVAEKVEGTVITLVRQAGENGQLYGSVSARDVATTLSDDGGVTIDRSQVVLDRPIKALGLHPIRIVLHPEVSVEITGNVARTEEEAAMQLERGGAVIGLEEEDDEEEVDVAELLEEGVEEPQPVEETAALIEGEDAPAETEVADDEDKPEA